MAALFFDAPIVREIAEELIEQHHPHLEYKTIEYLFRDDIPTQNGREVWGTAKKIGGQAAFLAKGKNQPFFVITISEPAWVGLSTEQRRALVDHELMHCVAEPDSDGVEQLKTVGHDFEGFVAEIERYGLWRDNAKTMAQAMQPHLPLGDEADDENIAVEISAGGKTAKTNTGILKQVANRIAQPVAVH
jgi:hypothetical protein